MKRVFGADYDPNTLTVAQFAAGARKWAKGVISVEPSQRTFGEIKRQVDGSFMAVDLINLINIATGFPGAAFGAKSTPLVMKATELLGIESQCNWDIATLNEVQAKFNLTTNKTFRKVFPFI
ncbi:hypothetical protein EG329_010537 [Mollisiaceae sp. DMI_Dod_QoI]|nr:hypothetical protein EG329_010537 [Helotiales sp. DMI_Dod_QoI]